MRGAPRGTRLSLDRKHIKTQLFARIRSVRGSVKYKVGCRFFGRSLFRYITKNARTPEEEAKRRAQYKENNLTKGASTSLFDGFHGVELPGYFFFVVKLLHWHGYVFFFNETVSHPSCGEKQQLLL